MESPSSSGSDDGLFSVAAQSFTPAAAAGGLWGLYSGHVQTKRILGWTRNDRYRFAANLAGKHGFRCGLFSGLYALTCCGLERYRRTNDSLNNYAAAGVAGLSVAAVNGGNLNWILTPPGLISIFCAAAMRAKREIDEEERERCR